MRHADLCLGAFAAVALASCSTEPARTNPFDSKAPPTVQAKAKVLGSVQLEASTAKAGVTLVLREVSGEAPVSHSTTSAEDGAFVLEVPPGLYNLSASIAGYRGASVSSLQLAPGEQRDVGLLSLGVARGALSGSVVLDDGLSPAGTAVTLIPLELPGAQPLTVLAAADGSFHAPELAAGAYRLRAEKTNYAPAYTDEGFAVGENQRQTAPPLRLYPAAAIVRVERDGLPLRFTNSREVSAVLLPFVESLEAMRLSEDPAFADARWDVDFREFTTPVDFTLADEEGERTIYAQFRDRLGLESEPFSGKVVFDRTAPGALSVTLNSGAAFLTAADGAGRATLAFTGHDALAGIDAWRYTMADAFTDEPFRPLDSVGPTVVDVQTVELGDADGLKTLRLQLRDRAGNLGDAEPAVIWRDRTPPALGSPALALDPAGLDPNGAARSLEVRLLFDVQPDREGERLYVAVANAPGLDARSAFVPLASPMVHRLAEGEDALARQVCAIFRDEAGLLTEQQCLSVTVDRSARLRGVARLEGGAAAAGTVVSLARLDPAAGAYQETGLTAVCGQDGGYLFAALTPGTYRLSFSHDGFAARSMEGLSLSESAELLVPEVLLAISRGDLRGTARLLGEASHEGIRVEAAPGHVAFTDSSGAYLFSGLPVGSYRPTAQKGTAFQPATSTQELRVEQGQTAVAAELVLQPVPSTLRGVVRLQGRAVHSGVSVVASGLTVAGSEQTASTTSDDAGLFSLTGLTAGTWRLTLSAPGFRTVREAIGEILLSPGEEEELGTWTLEQATGAIEGSVLLSDRSNHEGVRVALIASGAEREATFTAASGRYQFSGVPVGIYNLVATLGGYTRGTQTAISVTAEQTTTVPAMTLAPQVGNLWLEAQNGDLVGAATKLATVYVRGVYPAAASLLVCDDPAVQPHLGGTPDDLAPGACRSHPLTVAAEGEPWAPVAHTFAASNCPNPGDPDALCDGAKTLYARVTDAGGAASEWFELPVVLDRRPPTGAIAIAPTASTLDGDRFADGGAHYTRSAVVPVAVLAEEDRSAVAAGDLVAGVTRARIYRTAGDGAPLDLPLLEGGTTLQGVTLDSDADGVHRLYLVVEDAAGNLSVEDLPSVVCPDPRGAGLPGACDAIFLDRTPPASLAFSINPVDLLGSYAVGADWATNPVVQLGLDSTLTGRPEDEAVEATLSNDPTFAAAVAQPLSAPRTVLSWALSPGDGTRTVYVRVVDRAGNVSGRFEDSIALDTAAPEAPVLFAVGAFTRDPRPTLSFAAVAGAARYRLQLSDDASFQAAGAVSVDQLLTGTSFTPAAALPDGAYYWRVRAIDAAGLQSPFSSVDSFGVDTLAPDAPALTPVATPTRVNRPVLSWTAAGDAASFRIDLDTVATFDSGAGGTPLRSLSTPFSPVTPDILADGAWHWRVLSRDRAGNLSLPSLPGTFQVDTAAPANPVQTAPAGGALLASRSVTVSWNAVADAVAYLVDLSQSADLATWDRSETALTSRGLSLPADGDWYWRVLARDAAGNLSDLSSAPIRGVRIDTAAPEAPILVAVASPTSDATPTLSWSAVPGAADYLVTLDGAGTTVATTSHTPAVALADGSHTWTVAARDAAGNRSPGAPAQSFVVDTTPPSVPTLVAFTPDPTNIPSPTVTWSTTADAMSFGVQWDKVPTFNGAALGSASVSSAAHTLPLASDGTWYWRVRALDSVGNASAWAPVDSFVRDTAAPANPAPSSPANGALVASRSVSLSWTQVGDAAAYLVDFSQSSTLATWERVEATSTSKGLTFTADGDWYWRVLARDAAGNLSDLATAAVRRVQIDTAAPQAPVLAAVASPTSDATPTLSWSAVTGAADYLVTLDGSATAVAATSWTAAALSDGSHTWTVAARDAAGNRGPDAPAQAFVVDTTAPSAPALLAFAPDPTNLSSPTVTWSTTADATSFGVQWDKVPTFNGAELGSASVASTHHLLPLTSEGTWYWRVRALDSVGNASAWSTVDSFVRDTAAPANPALSSPANDALVASRSVTLSWTQVADAAAYFVDFSQAADLATFERVEAASTSKGLTFTADGDWYWRVLARDVAGNLSDLATAAVRRVRVDTAAPQAPSLVAVASPTSDATPTLSWSAVAGAADYLVTLDGSATAVAATSWTAAALSDGSHTWTVAARDAAGNRSADAPAQAFVVDTAAPNATDFSIVQSPYASQARVTLSIAAAGATGMMLSNASDFLGAAWEPFQSSRFWDLSAGDGAKAVYLKLRDEAGNVTVPSSAGTTLDTAAPGSLVVNVAGGAAFVTDSNPVTVSLSASDTNGVQGIWLSNDSGFSSGGWESYVTSRPNWTLTPGDGEKTVYVRFRDAAGNVSEKADGLVRDSAAPTLASVTIVGRNRDGSENQAATASLDVELELDGEGATAVAIGATTLSCAGASYDTPFATRVPFTLTSAGTAYVCLRDAAGNYTASPAFDSITVDQTAPGCTVTLKGYLADGAQLSPGINDTSTALRDVQLLSSCGAETPAAMAAVPSDQPLDCASASYGPFAATGSVYLSGADGAKNVRVCYRDAVGNYTAAPIGAATAMTLDTTPPGSPAVVVARNGQTAVATSTASSLVDLFLSASGASQMIYSCNPAFTACTATGGAWVSYSTAKLDLTLPAYSGTAPETCAASPNGVGRVVYAKFRDALRNESTVATNGIVLDTCAPAAPTVSISIPVGASAGYTNSRDLLVTVSGAANATKMRAVGEDNAACRAASTLTAYPLATSLMLSFATDGLKRACVYLEDEAGNLSAVSQATVTVDTAAPAAPVFTKGNFANVNAACVNLNHSTGASADVNFREWQIRSNGGSWLGVGSADTLKTVSLLQDTDNLIELRAVDHAGNVGQPNTAFVEEVSSQLMPTPMTVKQVCGSAGKFAILKDYSAQYPYALALLDQSALMNLPEIGLLYLDDLRLERFNGTGGLAQAWARRQQTDNELDLTVDAACAPANEKVVFSYLEYLPAGDNHRPYLVVWNDPLNNLDATITPLGPIGDGSTDFVFNEIDVVAWPDTDDDFNVFGTVGAFLLVVPFDSLRYASNVNGTVTVQGQMAGQVPPTNRKAATYRGLAFQPGVGYLYSKWTGSTWELMRTTSPTAAGSMLMSYTGWDAFGSKFFPARFRHYLTGTATNLEMVFNDAGTIKFQRAASATPELQALGSNGSADGAFFEQKAGKVDTDVVGWRDESYPKSMILAGNYKVGTPTQAFRYTIDETRPILSTRRTGAGEPMVLYHTASPIRGVVVGYRDEAVCAE